MDYFVDMLNFNLLKNHILKDPIVDWFTIQGDKDVNYQKDVSSYYRDYILKESGKYKEKLLHQIIQLSGEDVPIDTSHEVTMNMIKYGAPLIIRGKLYDMDLSLNVKCDIIIRYDLFKKLFPLIDNLPFHLLSKKRGYLLINICYSSLHFRMDLKTVANDGNSLYKKCSLYAFRECFTKITGERPPCFLLGKEYYYKKTLLSKKEFIGYIQFDQQIIQSFMKAYQWIQTLKKDFKQMKLLPLPTHKELYPNMNHKESDWENEKVKLANEIKEITLVWNITYDERCMFLDKGITCWDDPKLLLHLKQTKKKYIQERMIHMNQQKDILIHPRKNISSELSHIINHTDALYFDIESFLSFDEKQSLFNEDEDKIKGGEPVIGIIGFIYHGHYYDYTIEGFTNKEEKKIIQLFSDKLHQIMKGDCIYVYHWGHAEYNYLKYIREKYPEIKLPEIKLINILDYFRTEPIIVQGVFKFGLKSIGSALYKNGLIKTTWGDNDNGLDSMIRFKEYCTSKKENIPIKRYIEVKGIIDYNRIDCQVLYEIVELLRNKYII